MSEFSIPFMFASILLLASLGGVAFFWFVSRQLNDALRKTKRALAQKTEEAEKYKELAGAWNLLDYVPTLKELTDLTMKLHGQPSYQSGIEKSLLAGKVTADGVELSSVDIKRIPICFSYAQFMPDDVQLKEINQKLKEAIGPQASAHTLPSGQLQVSIDGEGYLYVGPVLLSAEYHDIEQVMQKLERAAYGPLR